MKIGAAVVSHNNALGRLFSGVQFFGKFLDGKTDFRRRYTLTGKIHGKFVVDRVIALNRKCRFIQLLLHWIKGDGNCSSAIGRQG